MGYKISWLKEKRVVLLEVEGDVDVEMLKQLAGELNNYLTSGDKPVHIVTDAVNMKTFPTSVSSVRAALRDLAPFGIDIIIGFHNPIARFIASVISQISKFEVRLVKDMDEGLQTLNRLDPNLNVATSSTASQSNRNTPQASGNSK